MFAVSSQFQVTNPDPGLSRLGGKRLLSVLGAPKLNGFVLIFTNVRITNMMGNNLCSAGQ